MASNYKATCCHNNEFHQQEKYLSLHILNPNAGEVNCEKTNSRGPDSWTGIAWLKDERKKEEKEDENRENWDF